MRVLLAFCTQPSKPKHTGEHDSLVARLLIRRHDRGYIDIPMVNNL